MSSSTLLGYVQEHGKHLVFSAAAEVLIRRISQPAPPARAIPPWEPEVFAFDAKPEGLSLALGLRAHRQQPEAAIRLSAPLNTGTEVAELPSVIAGNPPEVHAVTSFDRSSNKLSLDTTYLVKPI